MTQITEKLRLAIADRYVVERELGAGGMATVYLAQDLKHDRKVALKVLRPELAAVLGADRFVQEIKTTAALQHPHILPLFDSGTADGFLFYVMPFIDGETLRGKLNRESQLSVDEAVKITTDVADALHHAHTQGVIHRDIKPENILLQNGRPMVADFGIALAVSAAAGGRMTETGLSLGTPHYMSPEQATAEKEITARSDVYSLGSVLYEMLAGSPPHLGGSAQQIIMKIVTEEAAPVTKHRKSVPPHVAAAVAHAIEKVPADRFESAKAFAEALANPAFTTATSISGAASTRARVSVSPLTLVLGTALLVMTALSMWALLRSPPPLVPTHLRVAIAAHPIPAGLVGRDLAFSPDGNTIVFSDTVGGTRQLWIKTADRAEPEPLSGTAGGRAPTFSPDGVWIAFVAEGRLRKVPRTGGSAITIADSAESQFVPSVAWLDNGTIAFTSVQFDPRVVGQDGGVAQHPFDFSSSGIGAVSLGALPGGGAVLAALCPVGCPSATLVMMGFEGSTIDTLAEGVLRGWFLPDGRVVFVRTDGGVFAAPFDVKNRRFASPPVPVLDGVRAAATEADLALSVNGTLLYVPGPALQGTAAADVVWVSRDGVVSPVDTGWTVTPSGNGGIRISPDGRRVALAVTVAGSQDIWIKDLRGGPFTRLTFEGTNTRPEWSPDGRYVYFTRQTTSAQADLWRRRSDGTGGDEVALDLPRAIWEVQQPRDTSVLIVRFGVPPSRDIHLYHRNAGTGDSALTPLVANARYEETAVALSPDDRWLAYASNESGRYEIYVRPFPDANNGRWQISRDGGNEPRWAHSGRELFYRREDGNLVAVPVMGSGSGFTAGEQHVLFQASVFNVNGAYAEYDVAPDDRRFLFKRVIAPEGDAQLANTAILIQHWLDEVRGREAGGR